MQIDNSTSVRIDEYIKDLMKRLRPYLDVYVEETLEELGIREARLFVASSGLLFSEYGDYAYKVGLSQEDLSKVTPIRYIAIRLGYKYQEENVQIQLRLTTMADVSWGTPYTLEDAIGYNESGEISMVTEQVLSNHLLDPSTQFEKLRLDIRNLSPRILLNHFQDASTLIGTYPIKDEK